MIAFLLHPGDLALADWLKLLAFGLFPRRAGSYCRVDYLQGFRAKKIRVIQFRLKHGFEEW